ncbi:membrane protein [Paenibacillus baekrokdamisoli]|uniref:Membrane protein n=1 Tax=Paenibacillus baekrokdamisoli TaxID=1712516 RepID=A0A3G9JF76_9BACL|nr:DUF5808 domain-containing protein [Paenibacillus baekrokdamisoli]MBB3068280.1 putative membrane protein [Paenibacillus baekrokdamisoli]BBH22678.1 membrane protein [Paenibacillus baekrokdamisoli]
MNMSELVWISFIVTYLCVGALVILVPLLGTQSNLFGVVVPAANRLEPGIRSLKRSYIIQSIFAIIGGIAAGVLAGWLTGGITQVIVPTALTVELVGLLLVNARHYRAAARMKINNGWEQPVETRRVASLKFRSQRLVLANGWYLVHLGIVIVSVVFAALQWDRIPETLITHYNGSFEPDRYASKSFGSVFMLNIIQLLMIVLFIGTNFITRIAKQQLDPSQAAESMDKEQKFRFTSSVFLYGLSLLIILLFSYIQGSIIYEWSMDILKVVMIALPVVILGSVIVLILYLHRKGITHNTWGASNEEKHWKGGGAFYYNADDPALFVPKRFGIGWTVNMARPSSWLVVGAIIIIPISITIIASVVDKK